MTFVKEISGILCKFLPKESIQQTRKQLQTRLKRAKKIPGTRGFHQYVPLSHHEVDARRVSEKQAFNLIFGFESAQKHTKNIQPGEFVMCKFDSYHWLGMAMEINRQYEDVSIKFMHPHFPTSSSKWPVKDDICWVPNPSISTVVEAPIPSTLTSCQYCLLPSEIQKLDKKFNEIGTF